MRTARGQLCYDQTIRPSFLNTHTNTQTDRQTDRQTDTHAHTHACEHMQIEWGGGESERERGERERKREREIYTQVRRYAHTHTHARTDTHARTHSHTHTHLYKTETNRKQDLSFIIIQVRQARYRGHMRCIHKSATSLTLCIRLRLSQDSQYSAGVNSMTTLHALILGTLEAFGHVRHCASTFFPPFDVVGLVIGRRFCPLSAHVLDALSATPRTAALLFSPLILGQG